MKTSASSQRCLDVKASDNKHANFLFFDGSGTSSNRKITRLYIHFHTETNSNLRLYNFLEYSISTYSGPDIFAGYFYSLTEIYFAGSVISVSTCSTSTGKIGGFITNNRASSCKTFTST